MGKATRKPRGAKKKSPLQRLLGFIKRPPHVGDRPRPGKGPFNAEADERTVVEADAEEETLVDDGSVPTGSSRYQPRKALAIGIAVAHEIALKVKATSAANFLFELETPGVAGMTVRVRRESRGVELLFDGGDEQTLHSLALTREAILSKLREHGLEVVRIL
jgi:hypothetical protein